MSMSSSKSSSNLGRGLGLSLFGLSILVQHVQAHQVLFEQQGMIGSLYYDLTNKYCAASIGTDPMWAETSKINDGIPFCSGQEAVTLKQLGANNIVAMNRDWVTADPAKWCGKEVQVTDAQGNVLESSTGPLFIWDGCEECSRTPRVDLSGTVMNELQNGNCVLGLVPGLHVRVLDNNIWKRKPLGGRDPSFTGVAGTPEGNGPALIGPASVPSVSAPAPAVGASSVAVVPSLSANVLPAVPSPSVAAAPGGGGGPCTYGAEQCVGGVSQKCNYVDGVTHETAWVNLGPCAPEPAAVKRCPEKRRMEREGREVEGAEVDGGASLTAALTGA